MQFSSDNKNIGDLLNAKGITWGYFQGGFKPTARRPDGTAECGATHNIGEILGGTGKAGALPFGTKPDYVPHHEPFQYYPSTANPHHLPPSAIDKTGRTDQANHQYDLSDFWAAADAGHLPSVSFLKPPAYQNGHAGYSDPLDEQQFLVNTINHLQRLPEWRDMAIVVTYDDSDGWYDHKPSPIVSSSTTPEDALNGSGRCGDPAATPVRLPRALRVWPAAAAAGDIPLCQREFRGPHADRPNVDPAVHRGQLEHRPHRRPLV